MTECEATVEHDMESANQAATELEKSVSRETVIRRDEPLAKRTTLRVGGPADLYVEPANEADLAAVVRFCAGHKRPLFVLGRGSNLLVRDQGFRGVVICLAQPAFSRIEFTGERLRCGAGAKLKAVAVEAKRHGVAGLEFLEGIPGTVGGALRMNAGAMGVQTFENVVSVRYLDHEGKVHTKTPDELEVHYRHVPSLTRNYAVSAIFRGQPAAKEDIVRLLDESQKKRRISQPAASSAGCIFKNPAGGPAGKLVDELGLKNCAVGKARVSDVHGNFIVNDGGATASEMLELIEKIKTTAREVRGIELETEVQIVGEEA